MSANVENNWFQSWHDDWNVTNGFPLAAKGLFREMERWAVIGKPYGHVTWPNGEVMTLAMMATATGASLELIADYVSLMEKVRAIGLSKSGAYVMHHLVKRNEIRKKRAKSGKNGAEVTNGKEKGKKGLPQQVPDHLPRPINEKRELKEKNTKKEKIPMWWEGSVIRLNRTDYESWLKIYSGTDEQFMGWLKNRDDWFDANASPEAKRNWFMSTAAQLQKLSN